MVSLLCSVSKPHFISDEKELTMAICRLNLVFRNIATNSHRRVVGRISSRWEDGLAKGHSRNFSSIQRGIGEWSRRRDGRVARGRAHEIHFALAVLAPQINVEYEHGVVNLVAINLFARCNVGDDEANTWWWGNRSSILVTKAAHTGATWLLDHIEIVFATRELINFGEWCQSFSQTLVIGICGCGRLIGSWLLPHGLLVVLGMQRVWGGLRMAAVLLVLVLMLVRERLSLGVVWMRTRVRMLRMVREVMRRRRRMWGRVLVRVRV
jgi:hypothetical protein